MLFQKNKKLLKKPNIVLLFPVLVFSILGLISILNPSYASAYIDNDKLPVAEQQARTELYGIGACFEINDLARYVSGDRLNKQDIWGDTDSQRERSVSIGHEIDPSNGLRQCRNLDYDSALGFIGMTWNEFRDMAYEDNPNSDGYRRKSGAENRLDNLLQQKRNAKRQSSASAVGQEEKDRRILVALSRCIETYPDGQVATNTKVDMGTGENFQYKDGKNSGDKISVGHDLQQDGKYTCGTLVNLGKSAAQRLPADKKLSEQINAANATAKDGEEEFGCETWTSNPLNWVICPVVNTLVDAVDWLDKLITAQMVVDTKPIFGNSGGSCEYDKNNTKDVQSCIAYRSAWVSFRNIALGILLIAGLVVLISQALGLEILDAYTIRKILPRLLIVAVGITLSWTLMRFLVELTNDLGYGIRNLIYAPFEELPKKLDFTFGGEGITHYLFGGGILSAAAVTGVTVWIAAGGAGVILSFAGTALLAVAIALIVLILREMVIILFIIIAPIAIVMYVLPNTEKYYKFWWESFSKALLMFPFIAALIATGRVFAGLALSVETPTAINQVIAFVAYFAPYFMIPLTFKFAGGALSQIGGFVNSKGQTGFGMLSKYRAGKRKERISAARSGGLYRPEIGQFKLRPGGKQRSLGRILNAVGSGTLDADESWVANAGKTGLVPFTGRKSRILMGQINDATMDHSGKALQGIKGGLHYTTGRALGAQFQHFNAATQAALQADSRFYDKKKKQYIAPTGEKSIMALADIMDQHGGDSGAKAAQQLRANASYLGNLRGNPETQRGDIQTIGLMAAASAGRLDAKDLAATYNDSGNKDFAAKRLSQLEAMSAPKRTDLREGHGVHFRQDENGNKVAYSAYEDPTSNEAYASVMSMKGSELTNAKAETIEEATATMAHIVRTGSPEDSAAMRAQILAGLQSPYGDPGQQTAWRAAAEAAGIDLTPSPDTTPRPRFDTPDGAPPHAPPPVDPPGVPPPAP